VNERGRTGYRHILAEKGPAIEKGAGGVPPGIEYFELRKSIHHNELQVATLELFRRPG
jgi:hypothetical protein